ncbi:MAG: ImmA/IrrE family metallo-endopeptidase [Clostridia bacterium]|nr:ImmA/IrrE family metallo-endopeptidase [Clostridia bacterium]
METNRLYSLAKTHGIKIDRLSVPENKSVSVKFGENYFVCIDSELSSYDEKVCLAHELGHCVTSSFYNIYSPFDIREKHEKKADKWAIGKLIPKYLFTKALKDGYDNVYSLAEYFGVTTDFVQKAVDLYLAV